VKGAKMGSNNKAQQTLAICFGQFGPGAHGAQ
jgi:hypothetical protein